VVENRKLNDRRFGFVDGKCVFFRVAFLYRGFRTLNREQALGLYDRIEAMVTKFNAESNTGVNKVWQVAYDNWTWLELRGAAISEAFQGIGVSLTFAFIILLIMTGNVYVSVLSILCISSIILQLMGAIKAVGWNFGLIESTCVIVFIGIAVDYVVHLCHQYMHSVQLKRHGRTKAAFKQMGQTIIAGALTSIFSALFLMLCQAASLNKFGVLLLVTIVSSMLTALILLPSLFYILGPNNNQGNIN